MSGRAFNIASMSVISGWLLLIFWCSYQVFTLGSSKVYAENGLLENLQAVLLVSACMIFISAIIRGQRSDKLILFACALLCYGFFLRELDVQKLDVPALLILLGSGIGRNLTLLLATLLVLVMAGRNARHYGRAIRAYLRLPLFWLFVAAAVVLYSGDYFETADALQHHEFFEEGLELLAYGLILLAAFSAHLMITRQASVMPQGVPIPADHRR